ncbi:MAG: methionyl-tRNA formyltransferase [Bacteroidetes bacterium]|nr:methionyl-tRNA formyltransferase [Bacteroidota bacterium]
MKIVFMGTPDFAVPSLELLVQHGYTVSAVVTAPDKPRGRGQQVSFTPVKEISLKHSIPVLQPDSLKDPHFISQLSSLSPDIFVVVAFRILPKDVYTIPSKGSFNLHASLLPKYRGAAPINWAIINGDRESGVTTFFLQEKVDTGNVILQRRVPITDEMNAGALHDALSELGAAAVLETVQKIELGSATPQAQNDTLATPAPKIFKETCRINWNGTTHQLHNFIRGLSPYPAAWTMHDGKTIKIYKTRKAEIRDQRLEIRRGEINIHNAGLLVKTSDAWLEILELQQEGKKRMGTEEFLRGYRFNSGDRLE